MKTNKKPSKKYLKNLKLEVIERDGGRCVITGNPKFEIHHVFHGKNRKISNEHVEFMVCLCPELHRTTKKAVHRNGHELDMKLKWEAQQRFEANGHTREEFISLIGRSYEP